MSDGYRIGRAWATLPRPAAFALVAGVYLVAALVGAGAWAAVGGTHPVAAALVADVVATLVVFAASMVVANSSLYDPYWSVAPPLIAFGWVAASHTGVPAREALVAALIVLWSVRLTGHWAGTWRGLGHEDWRYVEMRAQTAGRLPWWLVSLLGIQLMPTLVVFAGLLSAWPAVSGTGGFGALDVLATLVTLAAVGVEATSDAQLKRFAADPAHRDRVADTGLWRWVRHPNYTGEIGYWWGLWLFGLAGNPRWWPTVAGPILMVLLFVFVSVPLMDRRSQARRPGYAGYLAEVPALLPTPRSLTRRAGSAR